MILLLFQIISNPRDVSSDVSINQTSPPPSVRSVPSTALPSHRHAFSDGADCLRFFPAHVRQARSTGFLPSPNRCHFRFPENRDRPNRADDSGHYPRAWYLDSILHGNGLVHPSHFSLGDGWYEPPDETDSSSESSRLSTEQVSSADPPDHPPLTNTTDLGNDGGLEDRSTDHLTTPSVDPAIPRDADTPAAADDDDDLWDVGYERDVEDEGEEEDEEEEEEEEEEEDWSDFEFLHIPFARTE